MTETQSHPHFCPKKDRCLPCPANTYRFSEHNNRVAVATSVRNGNDLLDSKASKPSGSIHVPPRWVVGWLPNCNTVGRAHPKLWRTIDIAGHSKRCNVTDRQALIWADARKRCVCIPYVQARGITYVPVITMRHWTYVQPRVSINEVACYRNEKALIG